MTRREARPKASPGPPRPERKCPICEKPATEEFHPFCSRRCADVDLHRWLSGVYVVPGTEAGTGREQDEDE